MKISKAKTSFLFGLICCVLAAPAADAQGLFNRKKKNPEPTTGGSLFPTGSAETSSSPSAPGESAIFKSGQPTNVTETDYVIQNGEKVEKKRRSFFQRRKNSNGSNSNIATVQDTPTFDVPTTPTPPVVTAPPVVNQPVITTPTVPAATAPSLPVVEKERRFGLPSLQNLPKPSLPFFKKDDEPIDTSRAEVLVRNGGSLTSSNGENDIDYRFQTNRTSTSNADRTPPREENGSKVYSSWADVGGRKTSAADEIVRDMKAQEAAHKRKIEAAKREYEERKRKAEADARIRAIMQGAMPPGGL